MLGGAREDDRGVVRAAVADLRRRTGLPVAFGGLAAGRDVQLTELSGTRTKALIRLEIRRGAGLGGRVLASGQPASVDDYRVDRRISHDYDVQVAAEGLRSVLAVPVVADGVVHGLLYGGVRQCQPIGERVAGAAMAAAADAGRELAIRAEVRRRVRLELQRRDAVVAEGGISSADLEQVRAAHAQLRLLAVAVDEDGLRERLDRVAQLLSQAVAGERPAPAPVLSRRELDVLAQVALGCTNAEAARCLGVAAETVKAYLRSASRKLDAHSRIEAVVAARRAGLLP